MKLLLMSNEIDILLDSIFSYLSLSPFVMNYSLAKTKQNKQKKSQSNKYLIIYLSCSITVCTYVFEWQHEAVNDRSFITIAVVDTLILT